VKELIMKRKTIILIVLAAALALVTVTTAFGKGKDNLAQVRSATARFHKVDRAVAAGWDLVPGLDYCFDNAPNGAMGYHYINTDLLDLELNARQPEALVYATGANGKLALVAVEYIVPAQAWDEAGNTALPALHGLDFHLNEKLGVYILHAWIWKHNPAGMFEDWNPTVSCP
jgi:hypothetical protein